MLLRDGLNTITLQNCTIEEYAVDLTKIPLGVEEHGAICRNAKLLHNNVLSDLRARNIKEDIWRSARDMALRYSHDEIERLLTELADKN